MSKETDGGPAFPRPGSAYMTDGGNEYHRGNPGMSLRDWFAGQALAAIIGDDHFEMSSIKGIALAAYQYADAMLKAREG